MPMPELYEGDRHVLAPTTTTVDAVPRSSNGNGDPPQSQESVTSARDSVSEIPFPFDSQSSIDEENGHRKTDNLSGYPMS